MSKYLSLLIVGLIFSILPRFGLHAVEVDAVSVSPDKFTILLENEHVRVLEYSLAPGERDQWHTHPPKVSHILSAGTLRITKESGESFLSEEEEGATIWRGDLGRHFAENVGETTVRVLLVEVKAAGAGQLEGEREGVVETPAAEKADRNGKE